MTGILSTIDDNLKNIFQQAHEINDNGHDQTAADQPEFHLFLIDHLRAALQQTGGMAELSKTPEGR
jgi:hypothetical protein